MDEKDVIIPEAAPAPLSEEDLIRRDEWAQFRLGLISSVVFNTHERRSERQELIRISGRGYKGPDGTMGKWSYQRPRPGAGAEVMIRTFHHCAVRPFVAPAGDPDKLLPL